MADRYSTIFGDQIDVTALGLGLEKDANDNIKAQVDDVTVAVGTAGIYVKANGIGVTQLDSSVAGDGLGGGNGTALYVKVDDTTIEISGDSLQVKDGGITEAKLDVSGTATTGYVLSWNGTSFEWISNEAAGAITESDFVAEVPAGTVNSLNKDYTLTYDPVDASLHLYLGGQFQIPGGDYTLTGTAITFAKEPKTGQKLYALYVKDN